jgi:hypothetical protein
MATFKLDVPKGLAAGLKEHFGECSPAALIEAADYAVRRKTALRKDARRIKAGKLARHLYAPRVVDGAPRKVAALASQLREAGEKLAAKEGRKS